MVVSRFVIASSAMGRGGLVWLVWSLSACSSPAPPPPSSSPTPISAPEPEPAAAEPHEVTVVQECGQDHAAEQPVVTGSLGDGDRVVRLLNKSQDDIQARLLGADLKPVIVGTLHIVPGGAGEFKVSAGSYFVRYRRGRNCEVRRGDRLELSGNRSGVEIGIKAQFDEGSKSHMRKVGEAL